MNEIRYMISDAAKKVDVEAHVLRYWEEELSLPINRNEMGHRYYTGEDVERLKRIKEMKDKGFQLKAIKMVLDNRMEIAKEAEPGNQVDAGAECREGSQMDNVTKFTLLMKKMIREVLKENNQEIIDSMNYQVGDRIMKEMNYLFREQEEQEEERYKRLDELIRSRQKSRREQQEKKEPFFRLPFQKAKSPQ